MANNCELCKQEKKTRWLYDNDRFYICICDSCDIPMIVRKAHTMELSSGDMLHLINILTEHFGGNWRLRTDQRKIKDHLHWHIIRGGG